MSFPWRRLLCALGVHHGMRFLTRTRGSVLMFHGFRHRENEGDWTPFLGNHVTADRLEKTLQYVKKYYNPIPLDEMIFAFEKGIALPPNALAVTMDDGYASVDRIAVPLLEKYGVPATVFLTTGFLDKEAPLWTDRLVTAVLKTTTSGLEVDLEGKRLTFALKTLEERVSAIKTLKLFLKAMPQEKRDCLLERIEREVNVRLLFNEEMPDYYQPLSWDDVRRLDRGGLVRFGAHTRSHFILSRTPEDLARREVVSSRRRIEEELGHPCDLFAYPNGEFGDFNALTRKILSEEGFRYALSTVVGFNSPKTDRFALRRIPVVQEMDALDLRLQMSLVVPILRKLKRMSWKTVQEKLNAY